VNTEEKLQAISDMARALGEAAAAKDPKASLRVLQRAVKKFENVINDPAAQASLAIGMAIGLSEQRAKNNVPADAPLSADELKTIRIACGLTQRDLARLIGVATPQVVRWETGVRPVPRQRAAQIRRELGLAA
jgi:DNA-binding transcriptional regulator YiaG